MRRTLPRRAAAALRDGLCDAVMAHWRLVSPALVDGGRRRGRGALRLDGRPRAADPRARAARRHGRDHERPAPLRSAAGGLGLTQLGGVGGPRRAGPRGGSGVASRPRRGPGCAPRARSVGWRSAVADSRRGGASPRAAARSPGRASRPKARSPRGRSRRNGTVRAARPCRPRGPGSRIAARRRRAASGPEAEGTTACTLAHFEHEQRSGRL